MGFLGVHLHLGSVGSDVRVGFADLGVGLGIESGKSDLLRVGGSTELLARKALVLAHDLTGLAETLTVGTVDLVLGSSDSSEVTLGLTHGLAEVVLRDLGLHSHLVEQSRLHLLASILVELHVLHHIDRLDGPGGKHVLRPKHWCLSVLSLMTQMP